MTLTAKDVAEITKLLEESSFDELYLELDGVKLSLRRGAAGPLHPATPSHGAAALHAQTPSHGAASPPPATPPRAATTRSAASSGTPAAATHSAGTADPMRSAHHQAAPTAPIADPSAHEVPAPLLGTFYRAPKPGALPFVEVGSTVEEDTIIGIIEVMKLMNTVRAGIRGRVTEILARDGALVEYGEALMRVSQTG